MRFLITAWAATLAGTYFVDAMTASSCSVASNPTHGPYLHCQEHGTLKSTKEAILATPAASSFQNCLNDCDGQKQCVSIGYNSNAKQCTLFAKSLDQMGFKQSQSGNTVYANRNCFLVCKTTSTKVLTKTTTSVAHVTDTESGTFVSSTIVSTTTTTPTTTCTPSPGMFKRLALASPKLERIKGDVIRKRAYTTVTTTTVTTKDVTSTTTSTTDVATVETSVTATSTAATVTAYASDGGTYTASNGIVFQRLTNTDFPGNDLAACMCDGDGICQLGNVSGPCASLNDCQDLAAAYIAANPSQNADGTSYTINGSPNAPPYCYVKTGVPGNACGQVQSFVVDSAFVLHS